MSDNKTDNVSENAPEKPEGFGFKRYEGQAIPGETIRLTDEQKAALKKRNRAVAFSLIAFMGLVFAITVLRLSQNIAAGAG